MSHADAVPARGDALLRVEDVVVQFGGVTAVNHASFVAEAGRITGLIGPNGAGKTTCFNVITGLQKPTRGRVWLDGRNVTSSPVHRRAHQGWRYLADEDAPSNDEDGSGLSDLPPRLYGRLASLALV